MEKWRMPKAVWPDGLTQTWCVWFALVLSGSMRQLRGGEVVTLTLERVIWGSKRGSWRSLVVGLGWPEWQPAVRHINKTAPRGSRVGLGLGSSKYRPGRKLLLGAGGGRGTGRLLEGIGPAE